MTDETTQDQQYDQSYYQENMVPLYFDDQVVIIIRGELALAAATKIGEIIAEAMKQPARRSGGNWSGKKDAPDLGLFRVPPKDLSKFNVGDTLKVPASGYFFKPNQQYGDKVIFISPFGPDGKLVQAGFGVDAASIKPGSKTWDKWFLKDGKAWEYDASGQRHTFPLRIITVCIGETDDKAKRYLFLVAIKPSEIADPEALSYTDPPT